MAGGGAAGSGKIDELESIRGIAAVLVVLFHLPAWLPDFHAIPLIRNGGHMVDVFFVLSGFVICRAYGTVIGGGRDALRFQLLRLGRLYPVHLLFLLPFVAIELAKLAQGDAANPAFERNDATALGLQLMLLQSFGPSEYWGSFNGPAWSISIEFYGYLLFALIVLIAGRWRGRVFIALALIGLALMAVPLLDNRNIVRFLAGFFTGCIVAEWSRDRAEMGIPGSVHAACAALLGLAVWFRPPFLWGTIPIVLATGLLIGSIACGADGIVRRSLRSAFLVRLGELSYTIYMAHFLIIFCAVQLLSRFAGRASAAIDGVSVTVLGTGEAVAMSAAVLLATYAISALAFALVERPLRAWSRIAVFGWLGPFVPAPKAGNQRPAC